MILLKHLISMYNNIKQVYLDEKYKINLKFDEKINNLPTSE